MIIHIVKPGETVYSIANLYGVSPLFLINTNQFTTTSLAVGQTVVILTPNVTHTITGGDTLSSIADRYGISVNEILRNNPNLRKNTPLLINSQIVISYDDARLKKITVNGYAYPFINRDLLHQTLPYLTYLTPFTYGIKNDGSLVPLNDEELIRTALDYGVKPLMHLSTLTEEDVFSNELSSLVLNSNDLQNILIENIFRNIKNKGYVGLDIDFEFIYPQEAVLYAQFIEKIRNRLAPEGYIVVAALAPKTSATQRGLLYEGHNYKAVGNAADFAFLMTYEWGYKYGPPMAVSPINSVRRVLDYALTEINRNKIWLGMPNYAYNWPIPFLSGSSAATTISNVEAVNTAIRYGVDILYDELSQTPHFNYTDESGNKREIWFDDAKSIREKLLLVNEYNLPGVGYWNIMRPFPQNLRVLNALYTISQ